MQSDDPNFWRAGAIGTTIVMPIVLAVFMIDSLDASRSLLIWAGSSLLWRC